MQASDNPFAIIEGIYYGAIFSIAFLAGLFQTLSAGNYRDCWHTIHRGGVAGFLALAIVAFLVGNLDSRGGSELKYVAVAIVIGLSIDRQEEIMRRLIDLILQKIGIESDIPNIQETKEAKGPPSSIEGGNSVGDRCDRDSLGSVKQHSPERPHQIHGEDDRGDR